MDPVNIDLDGTTMVNYIGLRTGNAFGFRFRVSVDGVPINAEDYDITLSMHDDKGERLTIADNEWAKTGDIFEKEYNSFPVTAPGKYNFNVTWITNTGKVETVIPGTFSIKKK